MAVAEVSRERTIAAGDAARLELAIRQARAGNPWPLVELQWGRVVRADDIEADPGIIDDLNTAGVRFIVLDDFQVDMIASMANTSIRDIFVKGNTGCGKGASAGIAVCVYFQIWDDARVIITRDKYDTAVSIMFAEVAAWWSRMRYLPAGYVVLTTAIFERADQHKHAITVANPKHAEGFSGVHGEHVLFVFDEATASPLEPRFKLADTQATKFLALANPRTTSGRFKAAFDMADDPDETQTILGPYGLRRLITVDGADMINVRFRRLDKPIAPAGGRDLNKTVYEPGIVIDGRSFEAGEMIPPEVFALAAPIIPGQTCYDTWLGHTKDTNRDWVLCFAHGRFPAEDKERQIIVGKHIRIAQRFHTWMIRAFERAEAYQDRTGNESRALRMLRKLFPIEAAGLDVGGSERGDPSVLTVGGSGGIHRQHFAQIADAEELADWVIDDVLQGVYGIDIDSVYLPLGVDSIGIGWGLASILRRRGAAVVELRGNDPSTVDPKRYRNLRAEGYGELGKRLDPSGAWKVHERDDGRIRGLPFAIPPDDELFEELKAHEKVFSGGEGFMFGVTPKRPVPGVTLKTQTIVEKIGRSPDKSDSAVYFYRALQVKGMALNEWLDAGAF